MAQICVLTSAARVADDVIAMAATALGGTPRRLSPHAVEIPMTPGATPPDIAGTDVNVVPARNRVKRVFLADMDSTMISVECIDELADFAGQKARVAAITERAMQGELDFAGALRERVALLAGVTLADVEACYQARVMPNPGAAELVQGMNEAGAMTALVSGGFTVFTGRVASRLGFQMNRANVLEFDGDVLTGRVVGPIVSGATKLETLNELVAERGLTQADVIAVGDGANDSAMVAAAGLGVAYYAKPALRDVADAVLDHSDLTALLALQGLSSTAP